jgi:hypothetical protein
MILRAEGCDFLDHDSYVELQQLTRHYGLEVDQADMLGRLNRTQVQALRVSVEHCDALSQEIKEFVLGQLDQY